MKNKELYKVFGAILLASFIPIGASTVFAQVKSGESKAGEKFYDFSGDDIDGELVRPDGDFIDPANIAEHTSLIKVRVDFIREIIKSAEDL